MSFGLTALSSEAALLLAMTASGPVLDLLFGKPDPWPEGVPDTSPASYPPDYRGDRR